jgi:hypothetical protein
VCLNARPQPHPLLLSHHSPTSQYKGGLSGTQLDKSESSRLLMFSLPSFQPEAVSLGNPDLTVDCQFAFPRVHSSISLCVYYISISLLSYCHCPTLVSIFKARCQDIRISLAPSTRRRQYRMPSSPTSLERREHGHGGSQRHRKKVLETLIRPWNCLTIFKTRLLTLI